MAFCLPQFASEKLLNAIKSGEVTPEKLTSMTSDERRTFLEQYVGKDDAKEVNAQLESKLILKDQNRGLAAWAKKMTNIDPKTKADFVERVSKMDKILSPEDKEKFLSDLAEKKLKVGVTAEEAQKISEMSKNVQDLADKNPKMSGVSDEYLNAREDMLRYINSLKPISAYQSIGKNLATIGRNNLLMNPATPLKTTFSQITNSAMDFVSRRLGAMSVKGDNYSLAQKANAEAWETFKKTGLNTASMESMDDTGRLGEANRFDVKTGMESANPVVKGVETAIRKTAQFSNKIAIDWEHNISFTKFYQKAFFDSTNVFSSMIAKGEKLAGADAKARSAEIMQDAVRIEPKTDEGAMVRSAAQQQAARVTSTNETLIARLSLGVKDAMNKAVPGLGDALLPIAKIPANVIWNGIENSGLGVPLGIKDIVQGRIKMQSDNMVTRYEGMSQMAGGMQKVARTVGVMSAAAYFSSQLKQSDFRKDNYGGSYVKIGNVWVNMEYMAAISPALAGMMSVKQNAKPNQNIASSINQYISGALTGLKNAPGINELSTLINDVTNKNYEAGIQKYASQFFTSRGTPAFFQNLMKNRPIERLFFGASGVETQQEVNQDNKAKAAAAAKTKAQNKK